MKHILNITTAAALSLLLVACGGGKADRGAVADKKAELEKLKGEQKKINEQIAKVEDELMKLDSSYGAAKAKLVALQTIGSDSFQHFIDLQGRIDAVNVAMVSPRGMGGVIRSIHVKPGQNVSKGQLIMRLDNALASQQLQQARQQIAGLEADLKLKQSIYERQQNLWKSNIGTEVQVLQAKTAVEAAASQLAAARAGVGTAQETVNQSNVYAEISGTVDVVNVKVGEVFSAQSAANPQTGIRIVNTGDLKIVVQVPENYLEKVNTGSVLQITLPEANNKVLTTKANAVSKLIDPVSRTFTVEGKIGQDKAIKANQIARVQIRDYASNNAITIPVNILQSDDKGKYILVAVTENGKLVARRKTVIVGELYADRLEVKSGLAIGDKIITDGFQSLYDGQLITEGK
ncbi:MAG: efflux transporter periplasmic adaptor subunit [Sphingobacteriales bacterium SCN 48-20]|uniref:efflux RND transporter periplasmic adaptor subunit n=1 Tax=Terrimonas ferruginea TaxID=249 RepID=UPI000423EB5F|nr:efflux RND transporter periplasmic adaptor subunit [Terrimonas ferruginea]MBN8782355.1 efflux RND transporter periplasmic adaptor subunit [Terrimonas ferruginea]ODT93052.1 MAG: efflux transporter periplasmic adaptor subunit [Sphingobacteriales bacterium SCN 48-20]OJW43182.1 MAG: efflux transporter periplasmic adaptor subunit [Sphingobacteriales bacterium 48-107]